MAILVYMATYFNASVACMSYEINKKEITLNFCENIDKPELSCQGKCFLMKKLNTQREKRPEVLDNRVSFQWLMSAIQEVETPFTEGIIHPEVVLTDHLYCADHQEIDHPPQV